MSDIEKSTKAKVIESKLEEVPEHLRDAIKGIVSEPEDIDKYLEALKSDPAEKKNDTPPAEDKPKAKPGEEGYVRHF